MKIIHPLILFIALSWCCQENSNSDNSMNEYSLFATRLDLPERSANAYSGSALAEILKPLSLKDREERIYSEIMSGNIPPFLRQLKPVSVSVTVGNTIWNLIFHVTADYMALGSDEDYFIIPMTPIIAQEIANAIGVIMITRKMVNDIWLQADLQLDPITIKQSQQMVSIPVFSDHNSLIWSQRQDNIGLNPLGALVSGHKKDVILSNRILENQDKVVIYGWHRGNGQPIQPLYSDHINWYADYSHGIRFALAECSVNGEKKNVEELLKDPQLYHLLSDEDGPMMMTRYPANKSSYP